ncbi:sensor histidine kinase [Salinibaculum rarum]|uniref:sensor histidine kinase n=1 Tax=Salinibaculum rarum TaxID=3058903 RepID=UPI00265DA5FE|nr:HAMP domain-containing sensor histidine kinase [Salinibaculum sp. KK48]
MGVSRLEQSPVKNPVLVLGVSLIVMTGVLAIIVNRPLPITLAQSLLPIIIGGALIVHGWMSDPEPVTQHFQLLLKWVLGGIVSFFLIGAWFGILSRLLNTSYIFAVYTSIATGTALGATIGIYATRLHAVNAELEDKTAELSERTTALEEKKEFLKTRSERLQDFASIVSHDVRNPLAVALGRLEMLDADEEQIATIQRQLNRIDTIIEDVLTLTREVEGEIETTQTNIEATAKQAWASIQSKEAELVIEDKALVEADANLLRELFENLFRNSIEHGGADVTITVGSQNDGFYIADDGEGIPEENRDKIFNTGFTTGEGTGLGMTIITRVAEVHGWDISASESKEGGARFNISTK